MSAQNHSLSAGPADDHARLDKFLSQKLADLSRARIQALIKENQVRGNGKIISDPAHKVKSGQTYTITIPEIRDVPIAAQSIPLDIVYEDKDILVLNKPPGLVVHPAAGNPDHTLVNALLAHCGDSLSGIGGEKRPGIVHRIDKDTSGILVIAKHDIAHQNLSKQFADHSIERTYQAFVWGIPNPGKGSISGNIGRSPQNRKKMAVVKSGGKRAATHYRTVKNFSGIVSLVECNLETGRTHQIRVHMTHIGHPLIGDQTYGRARKIKGLEKDITDYLYHYPRQALHAATLGFHHPVNGKFMQFKADLPKDLEILAEKLSKIG
ncbi:MAG: RluA family pseudouridine synthase [Alphaproteobacteria bacterium]|nr:MAG: RluA family pseudouridine synthase [Alphaproteobacteria bacterium]